VFCVCMDVFVYICIYVCVRVGMCIYARVCVYIYVYMYVCAYICMYVYKMFYRFLIEQLPSSLHFTTSQTLSLRFILKLSLLHSLPFPVSCRGLKLKSSINLLLSECMLRVYFHGYFTLDSDFNTLQKMNVLLRHVCSFHF